jgi:hypothetical protein
MAGGYLASALDPCRPSYRYVCLSYVWGGSDQFMTRLNNLAQLRRPGSIDAANVAQTIRHAITAVELLKERPRYLWVDALCIVQDDGQLKQQEINNMSGIYANAYLTMVAETGQNADAGPAGLPGVSTMGRDLSQRVWALGFVQTSL